MDKVALRAKLMTVLKAAELTKFQKAALNSLVEKLTEQIYLNSLSATETTAGNIAIGYTSNGDNFAVTTDSDSNAYVTIESITDEEIVEVVGETTN